MSLIHAMSIAHYTRLANSAAYSLMKLNNTRMSMISSMGSGMGYGYNTFDSIAAFDNELELNALTLSMQYKMAKAMLEQLKKQQKEDDAKSFSTFA